MAIKGELVGLGLIGADIVLKPCNIVLKQPTVKEIILCGEDEFFTTINLILQTDKILEDMRQQVSYKEAQLLNELIVFLTIYHNEPTMKKQIDSFFSLVFPTYKISFNNDSIDFRIKDSEDNKRVVGKIIPSNYFALQKSVETFFLPYSARKEEYNPVNEQAARIAEKLKKGKEKIAETRQEGDVSFFGSYLSILSIGLSIDIHILMEYTPFQLYDAFARYVRKIEEDQYFAISTVPFADTSNIEAPKQWTDNLYK